MIAEILLGLACALPLGWWLVSWRETQRSLQWWQSRQNAKFAQASEVIRNGLLQESFVVRRNLELYLTHSAQATDATEAKSLAALGNLHSELKDLSDRLSPAYLEESFPMAVQHWLAEWQVQQPSLLVHSEFPSEWSNESYDRHHFLLMVLDEFLQLMVQEDAIAPRLTQMQVELQQTQDRHRLSIQLGYGDGDVPLSASVRQHLNDLRRVFKLLTTGRCWYRVQPSSFCWHLDWRSLKVH